jgi:hypothetical protein
MRRDRKLLAREDAPAPNPCGVTTGAGAHSPTGEATVCQYDHTCRGPGRHNRDTLALLTGDGSGRETGLPTRIGAQPGRFRTAPNRECAAKQPGPRALPLGRLVVVSPDRPDGVEQRILSYLFPPRSDGGHSVTHTSPMRMGKVHYQGSTMNTQSVTMSRRHLSPGTFGP